jgi:hypothetical protein
LVLSVADLAYSGGEVFDLLGSFLAESELKANVQTVPLSDVVGSVRRLQPAVVIIGHRPLLDDEATQERWEAAGSPMGGDIIKALKSDPTTQDVPVLLLEGLVDIEQAAQVCGADAFWRTPADLGSLVDVIRELIERRIEGGG